MKTATYCRGNAIIKKGEFDETPATIISYTTGSDYSGDSVTRANYEFLCEEFKGVGGIYDVYGDYCTFAIAYIPEECTAEILAEIQEIEEKLEVYPVINENFLYEYEDKLVIKTIEEFEKTFKEIYIYDENSFQENAYEYFSGCSKQCFFVDYCESTAIEEIAYMCNAKKPLEKIKEIIEERGLEMVEILWESCEKEILFSSLLEYLDYKTIGKTIKAKFPLDYQISEIVKAIQE
jgi:hypothetical protein